MDAPETQYLVASPLRRHASLEVSTAGPAVAARAALERVHAAKHEFILHFDVDTINSEEFPWTDFPGAGGLTLNAVRDALRVFVSQPNLVAFVVAGYNPELDADGQGAHKLLELLADVLSVRMENLSAAAAGPSASSSAFSAPAATHSESAPATFSSEASSGAERDLAASDEFPDATDPDATAS